MPPPEIFSAPQKPVDYDALLALAESSLCGDLPHALGLSRTVIQLGHLAAIIMKHLHQPQPTVTVAFYWRGDGDRSGLTHPPQHLFLGPFQGETPERVIAVSGDGVCARAMHLKTPQEAEVLASCASAPSPSVELAVPVLLGPAQAAYVAGLLYVRAGVQSSDASKAPVAFSDEDRDGLVRLAALLPAHVAFPGAAAHTSPLADRHPLPQPPPSITVAAAPLPSSSQTSETVTCIGGWEFVARHGDRILDEQSEAELRRTLGEVTLPEMFFQDNYLKVGYTSAAGTPVVAVTFSAAAVLQRAAHYYNSREYQLTRGQLTFPLTEWWKSSTYERFDGGVDWAWRNDFLGIPHGATLREREKGMPDIDWALLKDQAIPIELFGKFDLLEDDLHDNGMIRSSLRYRVMRSAFYLLFRHFVCVYRHQLHVREARVFHKFGETHDGLPLILVEETVRTMSLPADNATLYSAKSEDELTMMAQVTSTTKLYATVGEQSGWRTLLR